MSGTRIFVAVISTTALLSSLLFGGGGAGDARAQNAARSDLRRAVALIDRQLAADWKAHKVEPAPNANGYEYIRRVTLDIAGRIPSPGEVEAFVADKGPDRRERLVDRLLASDDYAQRFTDVYMDLLVGRELRFRPRFANAPRAWLEDAFARNMPMDKMAFELLAASGDLDSNGATGFLVANRLRGGSLEQLSGAAARNFLGVQIQCAQCHDHPYDKRYKQADFQRFTAYFAGLQIRPRQDPLMGRVFEVRDRPRLQYAPAQKRLDKLGERGQYLVEPRFFGRQTPPRQGENRRQVLARTISQSELFAKVTVNRTWDLFFGSALVTPWDDLGGEGDPRHPPLLSKLALDFSSHGYDHKRLVKTIVLSRAYQRSSVGGKAPAGAEANLLETLHARARVRPLSASQLFYSQLAVTGVEQATRGHKQWQVGKRVERALREYLFTFSDDEGADADSFTGSVPQALLMRNGALSNQGTRAAAGLVLDRIMAKSSDPGQRLDWMFLTAYARPPTGAERRLFRAHLDGVSPADERARYADFFHALVTSTEFITNH